MVRRQTWNRPKFTIIRCNSTMFKTEDLKLRVVWWFFLQGNSQTLLQSGGKNVTYLLKERASQKTLTNGRGLRNEEISCSLLLISQSNLLIVAIRSPQGQEFACRPHYRPLIGKQKLNIITLRTVIVNRLSARRPDHHLTVSPRMTWWVLIIWSMTSREPGTALRDLSGT